MNEAELVRKLKPLAKYPRGTKFGGRVRQDEIEKRSIAGHIACQLIRDGQQVFIGEGSSGLWVALAILTLDRNVTILTNNAAVGIEKILRPHSRATVIGAQGTYDPEYAGIFSKEARWFSRRAAEAESVCIMPVTGLSYDAGPCAGSPDARSIKDEVMTHVVRELVILAEGGKLGQPRHPTSPVFASRKWQEIRNKGNLTVVCGRPPGVPAGDPATWDPNHCAPDQLAFAIEARRFAQNDRVRLRVVDFPPP